MGDGTNEKKNKKIKQIFTQDFLNDPSISFSLKRSVNGSLMILIIFFSLNTEGVKLFKI